MNNIQIPLGDYQEQAIYDLSLAYKEALHILLFKFNSRF